MTLEEKGEIDKKYGVIAIFGLENWETMKCEEYDHLLKSLFKKE